MKPVHTKEQIIAATEYVDRQIELLRSHNALRRDFDEKMRQKTIAKVVKAMPMAVSGNG